MSSLGRFLVAADRGSIGGAMVFTRRATSHKTVSPNSISGCSNGRLSNLGSCCRLPSDAERNSKVKPTKACCYVATQNSDIALIGLQPSAVLRTRKRRVRSLMQYPVFMGTQYAIIPICLLITESTWSTRTIFFPGTGSPRETRHRERNKETTSHMFGTCG